MNILYAGDSAVGGPANYLLGILRHLRANVTHIQPGKSLKPSVFRKHFNAIILSDFPHRDVPVVSEKKIVEQVEMGAGLLMVGGWASFSGPYGRWHGSAVEKLLPVRCLVKDDRKNISSGLIIKKKGNHPCLKGLSFKPSPVICGLNEVRAKAGSNVILTARTIAGEGKEYPLLVVDKDPEKRIAAFTTDFAPHWCGGLVDWGNNRTRLKVANHMYIEVGAHYIKLVSCIIRWLADKFSSLAAN